MRFAVRFAIAATADTVRLIAADGIREVHLGWDLSSLPDLQLVPQAGVRNLGEAIARRLMTPRGRLFYDADYGFDVRRYLNEAHSPEVEYEITRGVVEQCEMDPRVERATAEVSFNFQARTLTLLVTCEITPEQSSLVIPADMVTVEVLRAA